MKVAYSVGVRVVAVLWLLAPGCRAGVTGGAGKGTATTHGLSIPAGHPRLWFGTAARLAQGKAWYQGHPYTPNNDVGWEWTYPGWASTAMRGLLNNEAAQCSAAIDWALGVGSTMPMSGVSCDDCRWFGEQIILTFDWCYDFMTPQQRSTFIASTNSWVGHWRDQTTWGDPGMHQNNYYWGYARNELEWAITSYHENTAFAETTLDFVLTNRMANDFYRAAAPGGDSAGGVNIEGTQYGLYLPFYATVPWVSAGVLGRDLFAETNYWLEAVYALIHATTPGPTKMQSLGSLVYTFFPYSDDEDWLGSSGVSYTSGNFMAAAAMRWPNARVGQHARQWLNATGVKPSNYVQAVDPGGTARAFTDIPLDYYAPGARYLYGRNAWGSTSTAFAIWLGDRKNSTTGHTHEDWGTFQIWRNGSWVSRETVSYTEQIAGYNNGTARDAGTAIGHNGILMGGVGPAGTQWNSNGTATVKRLESQPAYVYADVDLTSPSSNFIHWEREFVFVRGLETMVILDRLESSAAGTTKTFLNHCETVPVTTANGATCTMGTQALVQTTLVPAAPTYRVVTEGTAVGQYRIEVDTNPGTAQSHILTVLQAKDSGAASLSPSVVDNGSSYTLTLDAGTRIIFNKGMTSTGGSITTGGSTTSFRGDLQSFTVTDDGPAWH